MAKEMRSKEAIFYPQIIRFLTKVLYSIVDSLLTFVWLWGRGVTETVFDREKVWSCNKDNAIC